MATNHRLSELNEDTTTPGHRQPSAVPPDPAVRSDLDGLSFMEKDMR